MSLDMQISLKELSIFAVNSIQNMPRTSAETNEFNASSQSTDSRIYGIAYQTECNNRTFRI